MNIVLDRLERIQNLIESKAILDREIEAMYLAPPRRNIDYELDTDEDSDPFYERPPCMMVKKAKKEKKKKTSTPTKKMLFMPSLSKPKPQPLPDPYKKTNKKIKTKRRKSIADMSRIKNVNRTKSPPKQYPDEMPPKPILHKPENTANVGSQTSNQINEPPQLKIHTVPAEVDSFETYADEFEECLYSVQKSQKNKYFSKWYDQQSMNQLRNNFHAALDKKKATNQNEEPKSILKNKIQASDSSSSSTSEPPIFDDTKSSDSGINEEAQHVNVSNTSISQKLDDILNHDSSEDVLFEDEIQNHKKDDISQNTELSELSSIQPNNNKKEERAVSDSDSLGLDQSSSSLDK